MTLAEATGVILAVMIGGFNLLCSFVLMEVADGGTEATKGSIAFLLSLGLAAEALFGVGGAVLAVIS
jgi:hypothetical protein